MMKLKKLLSNLALISSVFCSTQVLAAEQVKNTPAAEPTAVVQVAPQSDKVNINTADAAELQKSLIGIGAKKAEAIIQYREKHGNFSAAEQLLEVQGIGKATLEKNLNRIAL